MSDLHIDYYGNANIHFDNWVKSYERYINHLYNIFLSYLSPNEKREITFEKFCIFVYENSSGNIVDYL